MAIPHGREYRMRIVGANGAVEFSDWFNAHAEAIEALRHTKCSSEAKYFMQERNVFQEGEWGDPKMSESLIDIL